MLRKLEQYPDYNSDEHMAEKSEEITGKPEISFGDGISIEVHEVYGNKILEKQYETENSNTPVFSVLVLISVVLILMLISALVAYFVILRRKRKAYNVEQSRQKHQKDVVLVSENNV